MPSPGSSSCIGSWMLSQGGGSSGLALPPILGLRPGTCWNAGPCSPYTSPGSTRSTFWRPAWPGHSATRMALRLPQTPRSRGTQTMGSPVQGGHLSRLGGALQSTARPRSRPLPCSVPPSLGPSGLAACPALAGGGAHSLGLVAEGDERGACRGVQDLLGARV